MNKFLLSLACLGAALALPAAHAQTATPAAAGAPAPADDALFRALGGQAGIDRIVGDFVPRLKADPRTGEFFKKTDLDHLKLMLAQQFCVAKGTSRADIEACSTSTSALKSLLDTSMFSWAFFIGRPV